MTAPGGQRARAGSARTVVSSCEPYGERLRIARSVIGFHGPVRWT